MQSAPSVPEVDEAEPADTESTEEVTASADTDTDAQSDNTPAEEPDKASLDDTDDNADNGEKSAKNSAPTKPAKKSARGVGGLKAWILEHKKLAIGGGVGAIMLIVVLIWAFAIAPAVTITVGIRTTTTNFSESVTFTDKLADENISEGKFYLTEEKLEEKSEVEFTATGTKNVGEKATGSLVIYAYFAEKGSVVVNAGSVFTFNGLSYLSDKEVSLSWDGKNSTACSNSSGGDLKEVIKSGCLVSGRVPVTAEESGAKYNVAASNTGWTTTAKVNAYLDKAMTGGTDATVTVVSQADIDAALEKLKTANESINKEKLFDTINDDDFIIESSFRQTTGDAVSTPAIGEEVKDGAKAKLSVTTTASVYVIDATKVEEFIREKAKLADNYAIYNMNDPFVENFTKTDAGYTGKIKTSYTSGPKVTENDIVNIAKGKGLGTVQHDLKDINGISSIRIDTSYPWVMSVPSNPDKITVILDVQE